MNGYARRRRDAVAAMRADAVLPPAVRPRVAAVESSAPVTLVTGAAGFLGRQVVRELLRGPGRVVCLTRGNGEADARTRLVRALAEAGVDTAVIEARVEVVEGDVALPTLGLDRANFARLAAEVERIVHCAALLDWVRSYRQLRRTNVGAVLELIRLACSGPVKRLTFVSTIAVCYAHSGPERIDEATDMLPYIGDMPLGYAQSKCVAEALLREAASRGLPVTVVRPALISGDSRTGRASTSDLIAALIEGCVKSGLALDSDWLLDCVPVDFVARVVAALPQGPEPWRVVHLTHDRPRHWRELVLWMNLHGYRVALVDDANWCRLLFDERRARGTLIYRQRRFFRGERDAPPDARPYRSYLAGAQRRIDATASRALLATLGLAPAPLGSRLLHAYFRDYRRTGLLAPIADATPADPLAELLRGTWQATDPDRSAPCLDARGRPGRGDHRGATDPDRSAPCLDGIEGIPIETGDAILSEVASARPDGTVGLWRIRVDAGNGVVDAVVKGKADDLLIEALTLRLAALCDPGLHALFARFPDALGLEGAHERELALYRLDEPELRRYMPACYATRRDPVAGRWALLLEYLPEAGRASRRLTGEGLDAVINGLAAIHAAGSRGTAALAACRLAAPPDCARMVAMAPLWHALARFASRWFEAWCGPGCESLQHELIDTLPDWWPRLEALPRTLIHNDFNPRNFVLREGAEGTRLCVYDWELARFGVPQHDLAELLCYIANDRIDEAALAALVDAHRRALAAAGGPAIGAAASRAGFTLALRHLLIDRIASYALIHRFRPLGYLPRVVRNGLALYRLTAHWFEAGQVSGAKTPALD